MTVGQLTIAKTFKNKEQYKKRQKQHKIKDMKRKYGGREGRKENIVIPSKGLHLSKNDESKLT